MRETVGSLKALFILFGIVGIVGIFLLTLVLHIKVTSSLIILLLIHFFSQLLTYI